MSAREPLGGIAVLDRRRPIWVCVSLRCVKCRQLSVGIVRQAEVCFRQECPECELLAAFAIEKLSPPDSWAEACRLMSEADRHRERIEAFLRADPRPQRSPAGCYHFRKKVRRRGRELVVICADCLWTVTE